jgi:hypothetical protein
MILDFTAVSARDDNRVSLTSAAGEGNRKANYSQMQQMLRARCGSRAKFAAMNEAF